MSEAAPALTIVLLLLMPMLLPNRAEIDESIIARQTAVKDAMDGLPYTIGTWVGSDMDVPAVAYELLHPNAIFSRHYDKLPNGPAMSVVLVHCSDLRDMRGHYPPVCYPVNGWTASQPSGERGVPVQISTSLGTLPAQQYTYSRVLDHGSETSIRIFNFFVLPDGTLSREMADIYEQSERLAVSVQGACQVQIISSTATPQAKALESAGELLNGLKPLFRELGVAGDLNDA